MLGTGVKGKVGLIFPKKVKIDRVIARRQTYSKATGRENIIWTMELIAKRIETQ
jgi:hypothetical protein